MDGPADLGICIPVLNERDGIGGVLARIADHLRDGRWSVCLVDDGSTDGTLEVISRWMARETRLHLVQGRRAGKGCRRGQASRRGLEWLVAHTDHPVFVDLDADGSQRPEELSAGFARVCPPHTDVVIASKYVRGARVEGRSLGRRAASRAFSTALRLLLMRPDLHDFSNSYRFYSRRAAQALLSTPMRYEGPVHLLEMLAIWLANGFGVTEMPTWYDARVGGRSKVVARDFVVGAAGALDVALRLHAGRYRLEDVG